MKDLLYIFKLILDELLNNQDYNIVVKRTLNIFNDICLFRPSLFFFIVKNKALVVKLFIFFK